MSLMNSKKKKIVSASIVLTIAVVGIWFYKTHPRMEPKSPEAEQRHPAQASKTIVPVVPTESPAVDDSMKAQPVSTMPRPNEPLATRRMYAAHAPLRVPEVADPDSDTNRKILQTMVLKAIQHQATDEKASNAKTKQ